MAKEFDFRMDKLESLVIRLEKCVATLEKSGNLPAGGAISGGGGDEGDAMDSASLRDYSEWVDSSVTPFVELSNKIGMFFYRQET